MKLISQMDMFGANFQLKVDQENQQLKSIIGGFITIILYGIQLGYLSHYLYIWQDNQLLPTIYQTNSQATNQFMDLQFNSMIISFDNPKNPFEKEHNILVPFTGNLNASNGQSLDKDIVNQTNQKMLFNNITLMANQTDIIKFMNFGMCDQNLENYFNVSCAESHEGYKFLYINQLFVEFNITLNQYNVKSKRLESYQKIIPLVLDMSVVTYAQLNFKTGIYNIQQGTIFSQTDEIYCLQSLDLILQNYAQTAYNKQYSMNSPLILKFSLDQELQQTYIQYPLLGYVLAQVGSIVSLVMLFGYLVQSLNQVYLQNHLTNQIIHIYYPQSRKMKFKRNFINKITSIEYEDGIQGDTNVINFFCKVEKLAQNKLNILNIIYEISRIQFILQSLLLRNIIDQSHQLGISIPLHKLENKIKINNNKIDKKKAFTTFPLEQRIELNQINLQSINDQTKKDYAIQKVISPQEIIPIDNNKNNKNKINNKNNNNYNNINYNNKNCNNNNTYSTSVLQILKQNDSKQPEEINDISVVDEINLINQLNIFNQNQDERKQDELSLIEFNNLQANKIQYEIQQSKNEKIQQALQQITIQQRKYDIKLISYRKP